MLRLAKPGPDSSESVVSGFPARTENDPFLMENSRKLEQTEFREDFLVEAKRVETTA